MESLESWARAAAIPRVWVVTGGRAVNFYKRCGWQVVERLVVDSDEEATVLSKAMSDVSGPSARS